MTSTATRKRSRPRPAEPAGDGRDKLAAALRRAAEAESDPRLRAWILKLLDGDERERRG